MIGPAKIEGNEIAQWVLISNGNVVPRDNLIPLNVSYIQIPVGIKRIYTFDYLIRADRTMELLHQIHMNLRSNSNGNNTRMVMNIQGLFLILKTQ